MPKKRKTTRSKKKKQSFLSLNSTFFKIFGVVAVLVLAYFFTKNNLLRKAEIYQVSDFSNPFDKSLHIDGGYIQVADSENVIPDINKGFTVETWAKPDNLAFQDSTLVSKGANSEDAYRLWMSSTYNEQEQKYYLSYHFAVAEEDCKTFVTADITKTYDGSAVPNITTWHHVVGEVREGGTLSLYIDGQHETSGNGPLKSVCKSLNAPVTIGGRLPNDEGIQTFVGELEDTVITDSEKYTHSFELPVSPIMSDQNTVFVYHYNDSLKNDISSSYEGTPVGTNSFQSSSIPVPPPNPINWQTETVHLQADDFYLIADGKRYTGNVADFSLHSDPGSDTYTTLEATWHEKGVEMRFYLYFYADGNIATGSATTPSSWGVTEMRTYNGQPQGDWLYYPYKTSLAWVGNSSRTNTLNLTSKRGEQYMGELHFRNLEITAFSPKETPVPSPSPSSAPSSPIPSSPFPSPYVTTPPSPSIDPTSYPSPSLMPSPSPVPPRNDEISCQIRTYKLLPGDSNFPPTLLYYQNSTRELEAARSPLKVGDRYMYSFEVINSSHSPFKGTLYIRTKNLNGNNEPINIRNIKFGEYNNTTKTATFRYPIGLNGPRSFITKAAMLFEVTSGLKNTHNMGISFEYTLDNGLQYNGSCTRTVLEGGGIPLPSPTPVPTPTPTPLPENCHEETSVCLKSLVGGTCTGRIVCEVPSPSPIPYYSTKPSPTPLPYGCTMSTSGVCLLGIGSCRPVMVCKEPPITPYPSPSAPPVSSPVASTGEVCTQETGYCATSDGSCINYLDGCEKSKLCATPVKSCTPNIKNPPPGCTYQQVQCAQAPCDPILVCSSPAPTSGPTTGCYEKTEGYCLFNRLGACDSVVVCPVPTSTPTPFPTPTTTSVPVPSATAITTSAPSATPIPQGCYGDTEGICFFNRFGKCNQVIVCPKPSPTPVPTTTSYPSPSPVAIETAIPVPSPSLLPQKSPLSTPIPDNCYQERKGICLFGAIGSCDVMIACPVSSPTPIPSPDGGSYASPSPKILPSPTPLPYGCYEKTSGICVAGIGSCEKVVVCPQPPLPSSPPSPTPTPINSPLVVTPTPIPVYSTSPSYTSPNPSPVIVESSLQKDVTQGVEEPVIIQVITRIRRTSGRYFCMISTKTTHWNKYSWSDARESCQ